MVPVLPQILLSNQADNSHQKNLNLQAGFPLPVAAISPPPSSVPLLSHSLSSLSISSQGSISERRSSDDQFIPMQRSPDGGTPDGASSLAMHMPHRGRADGNVPPWPLASSPSLPSLLIMGREHCTRALLLSNVPVDTSREQLKTELEQWGPLRFLNVADQKDGCITVHYFDVRHAIAALYDIQYQHLLQQQRVRQQQQRLQGSQVQGIRQTDGQDSGELDGSGRNTKGLIGGCAVWAQYVNPVSHQCPKGNNQGTLVVFNIEANTPQEEVRKIFEVHGEVMEVRENPEKRQHKFVEFFDVRDAEVALNALDGVEVKKSKLKIEFSRPGGQAVRGRRRQQQMGGNQLEIQAKQPGVMVPLQPANPQQVGLFPGGDFVPVVGWPGDSAYNRVAGPTFPSQPSLPNSSAGYVYLAGYPPLPAGQIGQLQPTNVPNAPGSAYYTSTFSTFYPAVMQGRPYLGQVPAAPNASLGIPMGGTIRIVDVHQYGTTSKSMGVCMPIAYTQAWAPRNVAATGYGAATATASAPVHHRPASATKGSRETMRTLAGVSGDPAEISVGRRALDSQQWTSMMSTRVSPTGKHDGGQLLHGNMVHPKYAISDEFQQQENEQRTTVMIKNIPNKYSQAMLLEMLDSHCAAVNAKLGPDQPPSEYDFVYLPIDFKNKCNLGYAFVNFTTVAATLALHRHLHMQPWETFNSRKVCEITYARVQGRTAQEEHFRSSRFACDADEYLPLIFNPPRNGTNKTPQAVATGITPPVHGGGMPAHLNSSSE